MSGVEVDSGALYALISVIGAASLAFAGWVAREMYRTTALLASLEEKFDDHTRRLDALEAKR